MIRARNSSAVVAVPVAVPTEGLAIAGIHVSTLDLDGLLLRAKQGNSAAFGELMTRFERLVHGHIFRLTHDRQLSEDMAQDVFLQLWRVLPAFNSANGLPAWLRKVAINVVISHWRSQESQRQRLLAMQAAFPPKQVQGPAATLIEEEDRDEVRAALEMIPADLRSILMLRIYEDMSYEELAASLELEVGTVRSRLFRARQLLKEVLERWRQCGGQKRLDPAL